MGTTAKSEESRISLFVGTLTNPFCKEVTGDCGTYYRNRIQSEFIGIFGYSKFFQVGIPTPFYRAFYFLLLLAVIYLVYPYFLKGNLLLQNLGWKGVGTPALILSLFVVTSLPGCGVLPGTGGKDGDPPWVLALGANVAPGVPSIQNPGVGMTGGGSVGGVPVNGMFFFHPDHLGSITMITDGAGNPASGPEPGTSFVSYEPYGSIIRNDSYGPDIFRYKFTGQIEDKETGLYYYKARYYEPILGRFLQADTQVMPTNVNSMNRYMYVDGNPVNYRDVSGHVSGSGLMHMVNRIIGHAMGKDFNSKGLDKRLSTRGFSTGGNRFVHNATFVSRKRMFDLTNPGRFFYPNLRAVIKPMAVKKGTKKLRSNILELYYVRKLVLESEGTQMSSEEEEIAKIFYLLAPSITYSNVNSPLFAFLSHKFHL
ncbi:RHS repeat-associated core domain protein [Leptospira noguchii str. 1993005606]|nr:RHS repeat-associated core domain protein [Leptospira noguchii str. 1993005606]